MAVEDLVRKKIKNLVKYTGAREESAGDLLLLNANENPFFRNRPYNYYCEKQPGTLKQRLSRLYNVDENALLITRGSDEGIDVLIRAFCEPKEDAILICPPTYGMYAFTAAIQGVRVIEANLDSVNCDIDSALIDKQWDERCKMIFLCSPNNPTGNLLSRDNIIALCEKYQDKSLIVVDEAYIEYAQSESLCSLIRAYPNLVILRTLSKAYGLAAARCGSVLASQAVISYIEKVLPPYPIPGPVVEVVLRQLDEEKTKQEIAQILSERERLKAFLARLPFVKKVYPSDANFLLVHVNDAQAIMQHCFAYGIALRDRSGMRHCDQAIRITIGSKAENERLKEVMSYV